MKNLNQGAISDYNKAIELNPNYADAYNNRSIAKESIGDLNGACEDARKAISLGIVRIGTKVTIAVLNKEVNFTVTYVVVPLRRLTLREVWFRKDLLILRLNKALRLMSFA